MQTEVYTCHICQAEAHLEDNFCQECGSPLTRPRNSAANVQPAFRRSGLESPLLSTRSQEARGYESNYKALPATGSWRQTTITLGILTASLLALALAAAFLVWVVGLAKVPIVSYVRMHMAYMKQRAVKSVPNKVDELSNAAPVNVSATSVNQSNVKAVNQEAVGQKQATNLPAVTQIAQPVSFAQFSSANSAKGVSKPALPGLPVSKIYEQKTSTARTAPSKMANYPGQTMAEKSSRANIKIDPQENPPTAPNEEDNGYKPLMVNTNRTDADNHSGDGSFRIEMAGEKMPAKGEQSLVASKNAPTIKSRKINRNDDMATYNRLLAEYFSHPGAGADGNEQGGPPSFEEWIKNGKTNF